VAIDNTIRIGFDFRKGLHLEEAMRRVVAFVRFMEIVAGRPQNINQLSFSKKCSDGSRCDLDCYWSGVATRELSGESERPHPSDVLISPVRDPKHFCKVLRSWMARHDSRATARFRFSEAFAHQRRYPIDRLVGAANLFDLLPDDAVPVGVELSPALQDAKRKTKAIFRELPKSEERESVLGALGRMTKATLRKKITFRAKFITDKIGERLLPSLDTVIGEAVKCRNYFVHGTIPAIDYMKEGGDYVSFFTDALEFIFAASEFVEAGWKIESWIESGHVSHPFSGFIVDYKRACQQLQADLKSAKGEAGTSDEGSGAAT
jgi:hypothetical protein